MENSDARRCGVELAVLLAAGSVGAADFNSSLAPLIPLRFIGDKGRSVFPDVLPMPAPSPFLQMVDSGATLAQQAGYVGLVIAQSVYDGGVAFYKMGADLVAKDFESAKEHGVEALTFLLSMKIGESTKAWNSLKLKVKQWAFDVQQVAQGVIRRSPLEFLKKGPEGQQLVIKKETVPDASNPAAPPKEVTKLVKPEKVAQEVVDSLSLNLDGSVEYRPPTALGACFVAGTLVHTKEGLVPIEKIKVGNWVLSQPEMKGDHAYKRVVNTFVHEDKEVWLVEYVVSGEMTARSLVVTGNHPFWVENLGWTSAQTLAQGCNLELQSDPEAKTETCYVFRVRKVLSTEIPDVGWTYDSDMHGEVGPTIDLRDGTVKVSKTFEGDTYNSFAKELGQHLKRQVFNIEVEDFHTYYVDGPGVWVHNANCAAPHIDGTVAQKGVRLNNPSEASAGLSPRAEAFVYSQEGANRLARNLPVAQGLVLVRRPSTTKNGDAIRLSENAPGAMTMSVRSTISMAFAAYLITQRDGRGVIPLGELEQTNPLGESPVTKPRDH
ncbi:MAG: polymorphic toxin-type HINT domain-containing protein, partial [Anaerolineales bacterium]|nr:polymorphic toxin-type HINT domain-containing protein [Anaerolineales bacterium]MDP1981979.1 polymorphic toxin-type HINT domain-containing protein [Sulfuritalea sp.]